MVSHVNFAIDDDLKERADKVKDAEDLTWPEFVEAAVEVME